MKIAMQVGIKAQSSERTPKINTVRTGDKPSCHWLLQGLPVIKDDTIEILKDYEDREIY